MDEHHDIQIPRHGFAAFLERLRTLGIRTSFRAYWGQRALYLLDFDPARVPTLPSIEFIIQAVDGTLFQIAKVEPDEYLVATDNPNIYRVHLYEFPSPDGSFVLTPLVTMNILLHIDYENNRVGFADPLVEL